MYTHDQICQWPHIKHRFKALPVLDKKDIKPLWCMGVYDGTTSALILYKGEPCYAEHLGDPSDHRRSRRFFVTKLSPEGFLREQIQHALWRAYVGTHSDLGPSWDRFNIGGCHPDESKRSLFYDHPFVKSKPGRTASLNSSSEVLGWFEGFYPEKV